MKKLFINCTLIILCLALIQCNIDTDNSSVSITSNQALHSTVGNLKVLVISRSLGPTSLGDPSGWREEFRQKWLQTSFGKVDMDIQFSPVYVGPLVRKCKGNVDTRAVIEDALSYATLDYDDFADFDHLIVWPNIDFVVEAGCSFSNSGQVNGHYAYDTSTGLEIYDGHVALDVVQNLDWGRSRLNIANVHEVAHSFGSSTIVSHTDHLRCQGAAFSYVEGNPWQHNCTTVTPGGCSPLDILGLIRTSIDPMDQAVNFSGSKKLFWGWLDADHVTEGQGSSELFPVDDESLSTGTYLHKFTIPGTTWTYLFEYRAHAPAFHEATLPGVYVYLVDAASPGAVSYLLSTEPTHPETFWGVAPVVVGEPRLIDPHLDLYLEVVSVGETASIRVFRQAESSLIVAAGYYGQAFRSEDGITWEAHELPGASYVTDVAYGAGLFVVTGGQGDIWTSPDGKNWNPKTMGTGTWNSAVYCQERFYLAGRSSDIATSVSGASWSIETLSPSAELYGATCGADKVVWVGGDGVFFSKTANEEFWQSGKTNTIRDLYSVAFGDGVYVAVGQYGAIQRSSDGSSWTSVSSNTTKRMSDVIFAKGRFVAVGYGGAVLTSDDLGLTWSIGIPPEPNAYLLSIAFDASLERLVAGGIAGKAWYSDDFGTSWTPAYIDNPGRLANIWGLATRVNSQSELQSLHPSLKSMSIQPGNKKERELRAAID